MGKHLSVWVAYSASSKSNMLTKLDMSDVDHASQRIAPVECSAAYPEDGGIEVHPDAVLAAQVVPQLAALVVQLQHGDHIGLRICLYCAVRCLYLLSALHTNKERLCYTHGLRLCV